MIKRILDKYYSDNLKNHVYWYILGKYNLNILFIENRKEISVFIKKRKYKDYTKIGSWYKTNSFNHLIDIDNTINSIDNTIQEYLKDNSGD